MLHRHKSAYNESMRIRLIWAGLPFVAYLVLFVLALVNVLSMETTGKSIQLLTAFPLAWTFRNHLARLVYAVGEARPVYNPRLTRFASIISDIGTSDDEHEIQMAFIELFSLAMVVVYFVTGGIFQIIG